MKILFAGSGEFAIPTLRALLASSHEIVQIVTQPDRPAGRGRHLSPTAVARLAIESDRPLLRTADINRERLEPADSMIVIAFGQKIAPHQVAHARLGAMNLHGSRLPKLRGAAPVNWAIIRGETSTGNSIIRLAPKMDAGPILAQSELQIGELETAGELHNRLAMDGASLVHGVVNRMSQGSIMETPQDDSQASLAPKLTRQASRIDWHRSAREIACQIRGMYPWPGCHIGVTGHGAHAVLVRARPIEGEGKPGEVLENGSIAAGSGVVEIVEIQPEGKRPMSLASFRNGHPWHAGLQVESI